MNNPLETLNENELLNNNKIKLFIPLICHNQNANGWFMMSILKLTLMLKEKDIEAIYYPIFFESLVPRARNSSIAHFMGSDCTHLLFINSDIVFEPEAVLKLLEHNKEIIGGTYPKKYMRLGSNYPFDFTINGNIEIIENNPELFKVSNLPAGFSLIKRELINTLMNSNPNLKYINTMDEYASKEDIINNSFYNFYKCGINNNNEYLNEEDGFCELVTQSGVDIFLEPSLTLRHNGLFGYEGCFKDFLNIKIQELQQQQQMEQQQTNQQQQQMEQQQQSLGNQVQTTTELNNEELNKELFSQNL